MAKRAIRRVHLKRMKAKAERIYKNSFSHIPAKLVRTWANHLAMCSCAMCGNPRKFSKQPTRQEILMDLKQQRKFDE